MSGGPDIASASAVGEPQIADSAVVLGAARLGEGSVLAEGAVLRSFGTGVDIGTGSAVLENSVVVATGGMGTRIGRRSVFGTAASSWALWWATSARSGTHRCSCPARALGTGSSSARARSSRPE
jgi:hypothetical protein